MGQVLDPPNDNPGDGEPGDPGYTPASGPNTKIAVVTTNSAYTFTADQIFAAGGPWSAFTIRVTPINDNGSGVPQEVDYPAESMTPIGFDSTTITFDTTELTFDRT